MNCSLNKLEVVSRRCSKFSCSSMQASKQSEEQEKLVASEPAPDVLDATIEAAVEVVRPEHVQLVAKMSRYYRCEDVLQVKGRSTSAIRDSKGEFDENANEDRKHCGKAESFLSWTR